MVTVTSNLDMWYVYVVRVWRVNKLDFILASYLHNCLGANVKLDNKEIQCRKLKVILFDMISLLTLTYFIVRVKLFMDSTNLIKCYTVHGATSLFLIKWYFIDSSVMSAITDQFWFLPSWDKMGRNSINEIQYFDILDLIGWIDLEYFSTF